MKNLIRKILKESIPIYKETNPYSKMYERLRTHYNNTPEYVLKEIFKKLILDDKENIKKIIKYYYNDPVVFLKSSNGYWDSFLNGPWRLEILTVNPDDFDRNTVNAFIERDFGNINSYLVPNDEERMEVQKKLAKVDGTNEPIIVIQNKIGKYELIEGWHRTMSTLLLGDNGEDLKNWDKVKLRAFVKK
jgi:hypothetical protein